MFLNCSWLFLNDEFSSISCRINNLELVVKVLVEEAEDDDGGPDALLLDEKIEQHLHVRRSEIDLLQGARTRTWSSLVIGDDGDKKHCIRFSILLGGSPLKKFKNRF